MENRAQNCTKAYSDDRQKYFYLRSIGSLIMINVAFSSVKCSFLFDRC